MRSILTGGFGTEEIYVKNGIIRQERFMVQMAVPVNVCMEDILV